MRTWCGEGFMGSGNLHLIIYIRALLLLGKESEILNASRPAGTGEWAMMKMAISCSIRPRMTTSS